MTSKFWTVLAIALAAAPVVGANSAIAQTADWSGFYVGVQAGSGWGNDNNTLSQLVVPTELSADFKGFVGGAHLGWNTQMDSIVLGLETDIEASFMDADFGFTDDTFELEVDVMGSLRAKAGYAVENFLLYATGGLAVASSTYEDSNGGPSESFDTTAFGFTVGAGAEIAFSETLSGRLEYRFTDLGQETFDSAIFDPTVILKANYEFHAVRAGLSWHF